MCQEPLYKSLHREFSTVRRERPEWTQSEGIAYFSFTLFTLYYHRSYSTENSRVDSSSRQYFKFSKYILFDEGSKSPFITLEQMARKLEIKLQEERLCACQVLAIKNDVSRPLGASVMCLKTPEDVPIKILILPEISVRLKTCRNQEKRTLTWKVNLT